MLVFGQNVVFTVRESLLKIMRRMIMNSSWRLAVDLSAAGCAHCCFTSIRTVRSVRDGDRTRTSTSTFTQLLTSDTGS